MFTTKTTILLSMSGQENLSAKLSNDDVRLIRELYIEGDGEFGGRALAKIFGVTETTIRNVILGKTYTSVK